MKMKTMDRAGARFVRDELPKALESFCKKNGLRLELGGAKFSTDLVKIQVTFILETGKSQLVKDYEMVQKHYNLPPLGTLIQIGKDMFTIIGWKSGAKKNSILIQRPDGKEFVSSIEVINKAKKLGKSPYKGKK